MHCIWVIILMGSLYIAAKSLSCGMGFSDARAGLLRGVWFHSSAKFGSSFGSGGFFHSFFFSVVVFNFFVSVFFDCDDRLYFLYLRCRFEIGCPLHG